MKINTIEILDFKPIKHIKLENLGEIVIIAGANGSGKTRMKQAIVQTLLGNSNPAFATLELSATRKKEEADFEGKTITVKQGGTNHTLNRYISNRKFGQAKYVGALLQIGADRYIQSIGYSQVNWLGSDPDDVDTPPTWGYQEFTDRWKDFMNYIHQKAAIREKKIAEEVKKGKGLSDQDILKIHPDPLDKYKDIFKNVIPDKELLDIDPAQPSDFKYKDNNGDVLSFGTLSSGEQEVIKILFDVARKEIKHSIVIVDEPELHLHPTLTFKLIESLKDIGENTNQYIFLTHSADLIGTYFATGNAYFIDSKKTGANQAHRLSDLNHSHKEIVQLVGANLGLFAVGKKIIFVEGEESSIDKLTYSKLAEKYFPEAKVIPVGSVMSVHAMHELEVQIRNSIFGIDFFMIRDKDGLSDEQITVLEENGKIKCLKKRHIENYFLDSEILYKVVKRLYLDTQNPQLTRQFIHEGLKRIAHEQVKRNLLQNTKDYLETNVHFNIPTVKDIQVKNEDDIIQEMTQKLQENAVQLTSATSQTTIETWMRNERSRLETLLSENEWLNEFKGKDLFTELCSRVLSGNPIQVRQAYIDIALSEKPEVFADLKEIMDSFQTI